jgi:hypothetical protein
MLSFFFMTATVVAVYWFSIRPILKSRPTFAEFYSREESVFAAVREKLKGIKQKLSSVIVIAASAAVSSYDFITSIVGGVDVSSITAQVPSWAWPIVLTCITALFQLPAQSCRQPTREKSWPTRPPARRRTKVMWNWLASIIGGPVITGLINAYKAKLDASNTQDRIAADGVSRSAQGSARDHHRRAGLMVHSDHPAVAGVPADHLPLEGDRLGQGPRSRKHRSHHRHGSGLHRYDHQASR